VTESGRSAGGAAIASGVREDGWFDHGTCRPDGDPRAGAGRGRVGAGRAGRSGWACYYALLRSRRDSSCCEADFSTVAAASRPPEPGW